MKESRKIQMSLLRDMIATADIRLDFNFGAIYELILDRQYFLPVTASWTTDECSAWQERNVNWLVNYFHLDRKAAEVEVSWFIDRYGIKAQ